MITNSYWVSFRNGKNVLKVVVRVAELDQSNKNHQTVNFKE